MSHQKQPERRTFLQERLEILIKKQEEGTATFNELTELDEMVNGDPILREKIIMESLFPEEMKKYDDFQNPEQSDNIVKQVTRRSLLTRLKSFIDRIFTSHISALKTKILVGRTGQIVFV